MKHFQTPTPQNTLRRRLTTYFVGITGACLAHATPGAVCLRQPLISRAHRDRGASREQAVSTGPRRRYAELHVSPLSLYLFPVPLPLAMPGPSSGRRQLLFNVYGTQIITHFLSPNPVEADTSRATWQDSRDSSAVWANKNERGRCRESECDSLATARCGRIGGRAHQRGTGSRRPHISIG